MNIADVEENVHELLKNYTEENFVYQLFGSGHFFGEDPR